MVGIIVPHAPAWECSSRRSASQEDAERRTIIELSAQTDAELQYDSWDYRSSRSSVGMQVMTLCVAKRTRSVQTCMSTQSVAR
ncbi:hypothetical protein FFH21_010265 [Pseudomonas sp. KBS0707]|nr:hypothetical protein FFH21_010265 [Pseudomonas sp. KBS0707]